MAGLPCAWGSPLFAGHVPDLDELPAARLRAAGLVLLGPLAWSWWQEARGGQAPGRPVGGRMGRAEALSVLGLQDPVSESDVREAWVRLMRVAHPDGGGSDWLAARVNQAKDVLLGRR